MKTINFSYEGKLLNTILSKAVSVFLCVAIITIQIDTNSAEAATTTPPPSTIYQGAGTDADSSNPQSHGPIQTQSSSSGGMKLMAMAASASDSGTGGAQTQTSFSSLTGPLGTTKQIYQTDLFTGRASVNIPIVVSPGRGNVQPDIGIVYTSGGGNSWCGIGWDLSIGSIERSTRKGVPSYDNSKDTFTATFSGVQSDLVSIGNGEYRAKYDPSYLKFKYDGTSWIVWDKNGTKYVFGSSASSRVDNTYSTFKWCLDRVTSIDTNYMTIAYVKDSGEIYPDTISYTGNDTTGDAPRQTVKFNLESPTRSDIYENYRSGAKVTTQYRLSNIEVKCDGSLVRKYQFQYTVSPNTYKSLLTSVVQYGADGTSALPPTTFTYQSGVNGWTENSTWTIPDGSFVDGNADQGRCLVDLNGDGLPDFMVAIANQSGTWTEKTYKNTGNGWTYDSGWNAPNGNFIWITQGKNIDDGRRLADVNGDGFPDWIVANKYWIGGSDYNYGTYLNGKTYWNTSSSNQWNIPDGFFASIGADQGRRFADVNGDGLPDFLVAFSGTRVTYLNNENGWTRTDSWNVPDGDFSQGAQLVDLNGDGLADLVIAKDGVKATYINNNKGWTRDDTWNIPDGNLYESSKPCGRVFTDINGDGLPDLVIAQDGYKSTYINTGHGWQKNDVWNITDGEIITSGQDQGRRFSDVNGDGVEDLVIGNGSYRKTYLNASPVPDILQKVTNGIGGSTTISYTPSTKYYNNGPDSICDLPIILQTVSSVTSDDGMGHSYTVTYKYWDGMFDVSNREFLGFDQVRETDADGNYVDNWFKQDSKYKGRLYLQETKDKLGNLYSRLWNYWECFEPYTGVYLPYLKSQDRYIYDGDPNNFKRTQTAYEYDSYGNLTKISYSGDDTAGWGTILGDEKYVYCEYVYNQDKWILGRASHTYTTDSNGNKVSEGWRYYDENSNWYGVTPTFGRLTKEEKWSNSASNTVVTMEYDTYGNATSVKDAKGRTVTTRYDSIYHMYPDLVTNDLLQTQSATYDPKTGQVLTSTDPNGQVSTRVYDTFGRAKQAFGPYDDSSHPVAWYEYDLSSIPVKVTAYAREENNTDDSNKIRTTYTFSDGLGKTIEVKSDAQDPAKQIISNVVVYNNRGLTDSKFFSYLITQVTDRAKYVAPDFTQPKASFQYDPVGRVIKTINPDNTYSTTTYARLVTTFTDENGHQKRSTKDVYGRVFKIEEFNGDSVYTTTYTYNTLDSLTKTVDTLGNTATIQYDSLGRKISMNDPDTGAWGYLYDEVGNLKSQTDAKGQTITFTYDNLNRLTKKTYPSGASVIYTYDIYPAGIPSGPDVTGRLTSVTDASGMTLFYYDRIGREIKTLKTVDSVSYTTLRSYDALGRLISVTSPDGEVITYTYNRQGGIDRVAGSRTYVSSVTYSATGQMLSLTYGNGVVTNYQYDPNTLRLTHLTTQDSQSTKLQDLGYTFDNIGNVKTLTDASPTGTNTQSFEYDDLYRLTNSTGAGYGAISYQYDPIGNMTQKGDLTLSYPNTGATRPHAVKTVVRNGQTIYTPTYDANGNMTQKGSQVLQYDYENRLVQVGSSQTSGTVQVQIALRPGMNLISLPVILADTTILGALSSLRFGTDYTQVSRYNAVTKTFEHWVNNPKFDQFKTLDYGVGYQIYVSNPSGCTLTVTGNYPSQASNIALASGYNLIGAPTSTSKSVIESLSNLKFGTDYDKVARYNSTTKTFEYFYNNPSTDNFTIMDKGCAYYVRMLKAATWQIPLVFQGTTTFIYDGDGGRVKKISPDGTQSIYVGSGYEITRNPDNTSSTIKSIFLGNNRICETVAAGVYYFHQDHIGSSNVITDSTGKQVACYEYKPYGETSKISGSFSTDIRFTGQRLDSSTGFYYYGARYYDPELGRFIQPDTIIAQPFDPQGLNRYAYCRNNPINYVDPTGHKNIFAQFWDWLTGSIGNIVGAIVGAAVAIVSGNLWLGFQAYSMTSLVINAATSGNWGGLAGGIAGGLIGGALGIGTASGIYSALGQSSFTFGGGFLGGAAEFGLSGFGSGFGYALGSGEKVGDALQSGLISGGISAAIGGVIQGSYNAGWQNSVHGMNRGAVGKSAGLERKVSLELTIKPISKPITIATGGGIAGDHWGLRVRDTYNEFNGTWDFGANLSAVDKAVVGFGGSVMASAESAVGRGWTDAIPIQSTLKYATDVYGNIQQNLGRHEYRLDSYTCQTWVNNRLNLRNDNFTN